MGRRLYRDFGPDHGHDVTIEYATSTGTSNGATDDTDYTGTTEPTIMAKPLGGKGSYSVDITDEPSKTARH